MTTTIRTTYRRPPLIMETERLLLRKPRLEDAESLFEIYASTQELTRHLPKDLEGVRALLIRTINLWNDGLQFNYIIEDKETSTTIGLIGLGEFDLSTSISNALARDFQNKGYMTEAVKALTCLNLPHLKCHRIDAAGDLNLTSPTGAKEKAGAGLKRAPRHWSMLTPQIHGPSRNRRAASIFT